MSDSQSETRLPEEPGNSSESPSPETVAEVSTPEPPVVEETVARPETEAAADATPAQEAELEVKPESKVEMESVLSGAATVATDAKPADDKPADAKPADAKSVEVKSDEAKPVEAKTEAAPESAAETAAESAAEPLAEAKAEAGAEASAEAGTESQASAGEAAAPKPKKKRPRKRKPKVKPPVEPQPESEALIALRKAKEEKTPVEGRVFGFNNGGFHVVIGAIPAFCPRSEIKASQSIGDPESYVDKTFEFRVLKIQSHGKRIVVSRSVIEREEQQAQRSETMKSLEAGATVSGKVTSIADFGAFVDLGGGLEGLVHISEISRQRVENPADVLEMGQEVEVKILKIEKGGKRISLSMKALLPDPWRDIKDRFEEGSIVVGRVERTGRPGAFIELEPGLTGLLPTSEMNLPRDAIAARLYPPGREVKVMIAQVDVRRRRIALAPEGAAVGGSRSDFMNFKKQADVGEGFNAMAAALAKFKK
ncbi:MAG: S1 RNA-binding domain-containing protein [Thermoanaerobaculia bacterium]|nr:S1 RNA-binding domain-containing protein [Thermoanaerobaculia bacterium]